MSTAGGPGELSRYSDFPRAGNRIAPIAAAERLKARVCGHSSAGTAASNPVRTMVFLLCVVEE